MPPRSRRSGKGSSRGLVPISVSDNALHRSTRHFRSGRSPAHRQLVSHNSHASSHTDRKRPRAQPRNRCDHQATAQLLALAMANTSSHTSLPASEFTTTFAGFLDAHSDATPNERCSSVTTATEQLSRQRSATWRIGKANKPQDENQPAVRQLSRVPRNWLPARSRIRLVPIRPASFYRTSLPKRTDQYSHRQIRYGSSLSHAGEVWHSVCLVLYFKATRNSIISIAFADDAVAGPYWMRTSTTGGSS